MTRHVLDAAVLLDGVARAWANDISPDERLLLDTAGDNGLWIPDLETLATRPLVANGFTERIGRFSPDGQRLLPNRVAPVDARRPFVLIRGRQVGLERF